MRGLVPGAVRRRLAGPVGRYRGARIRSRLAALAAGGRPILAGPWMGEVGFEILYWAPFLRWVASEFDIAPERFWVLSRGGTSSWYGAAAGRYYDVFDYLSLEEFRAWHEDRISETGEQKQTRITDRERRLLDRVLETTGGGTDILHPGVMYELMNPFWWRHLDEGWVRRHTVYRRLERPPKVEGLTLPEQYVAVKFYFNDCFPPTDQNRDFVRRTIARLAQEGPVVSLSAGHALDDHGACAVSAYGVLDVADAAPAKNLQVQSAIVAHAASFVGTYGGFAYLAPFYGVPSTSYYGDPGGFARSHLQMASAAFAAIGSPGLLEVRQTPDVSAWS
ncbi:MAG: hypothetical protein A3F70_00755 [Acidobacteria bacterium RIFCSPLOWO2_12_FULL_67_14]|nr:MAG: hypothetical protein A3H29_10370 [Acidobacteria bacterium RIFCSPLOWO2_02_FULL_67_21]OFW36139.1 MAG: hypothetical protein A3F70_00755 [Acidobacteria bacterium RIFCSPLOWO2_12_FULL_67_14]